MRRGVRLCPWWRQRVVHRRRRPALLRCLRSRRRAATAIARGAAATRAAPPLRGTTKMQKLLPLGCGATSAFFARLLPFALQLLPACLALQHLLHHRATKRLRDPASRAVCRADDGRAQKTRTPKRACHGAATETLLRRGEAEEERELGANAPHHRGRTTTTFSAMRSTA